MGRRPIISDEKVQEIRELLKNPNLSQLKIAEKVGVSHETVYRIKRNKFRPKRQPTFLVEQLENGNVIRPSTKGLVPASTIRAKLCQAYFYLERDKSKAKEAISYCLAIVDEADK